MPPLPHPPVDTGLPLWYFIGAALVLAVVFVVAAANRFWL